MSKMKTLKLFFVCFLILSFASMAIAKPAMGMGKAPGKKNAAVAEAPEIPQRPELPSYPAGMEDGIARNPDGSTRYLLSVEEDFQPSDVEAINGTCEWSWPEAGIAAVSSFSQTFVEDAEGNIENNINYAVPEPLVIYDTFFMSNDQSTAQTTQGLVDDAYASGLQWPLQAIGAVRYAEDGRTPEWQLGDYEGEGVTVALIDSGMPAIWLSNDEAPYESRLHPDFAWYEPGDGGVVPIFLGWDFETDAPKDPDTGLPMGNPDNYYYQYCDKYPDPPLDQVIIDPVIGGFADSVGHGTSCSGPIAARHNPAVVGTMRGIAPKVKLICYKTVISGTWQHPGDVLYAFKRASHDGVQVINASWGYFFTKNDMILPAYVPGFRQIFINALEELDKQNILICSAAGNDGGSYIDIHKSSPSSIFGGPLWIIPQMYISNVLNVSGTGPRDYDPDAPDLSVYDPTPGIQKLTITEKWPDGYPSTEVEFIIPGGMNNLDRPGAFEWPWSSTNFGKEMAAIDIAAPCGSLDSPNPNSYYHSYSKYNFNEELGYHRRTNGTSRSAPTVTGVAALAIEAYRRAHGQNPSVGQLKSILLNSADDMVGPPSDVIYKWDGGDFLDDYFFGGVDPWSLKMLEADKPAKDDFYGHGRVNAKKAILEAGGTLP